MSDIDVTVNQLALTTQKIQTRLEDIEKTLGQTPDPATLRHIEHVIKELPNTDSLKDVVKARGERAMMFKRITWVVLSSVLGTLALATLSIIWQGIHLVFNGGVS